MMTLCVTLLAAACVRPDAGFYQALHVYEPSPAAREASGRDGEVALPHDASVAFELQGCDATVAPSPLRAHDERVDDLVCARFLAELELAALAAGHRVIHWRDARRGDATTEPDLMVMLRLARLRVRADRSLAHVKTTYRRTSRYASDEGVELATDSLSKATRERCARAEREHAARSIPAQRLELVVRDERLAIERGRAWSLTVADLPARVPRLEDSSPANASESFQWNALPLVLLMAGAPTVAIGVSSDDPAAIGIGIGLLVAGLPLAAVLPAPHVIWSDADDAMCTAGRFGWEHDTPSLALDDRAHTRRLIATILSWLRESPGQRAEAP